MGYVDPKVGCKIWTLFWGPPNCFSFGGLQNGVQILGPILRSTLPVFFSQRDAEKDHPRVGCLWAGSFSWELWPCSFWRFFGGLCWCFGSFRFSVSCFFSCLFSFCTWTASYPRDFAQLQRKNTCFFSCLFSSPVERWWHFCSFIFLKTM